MFKITQGKGFHMTFANGWTVSVQWGAGNYSDHNSALDTPNAALGAKGSATAEIAAWDKDGKWFNFGHDEVRGYVRADEVLAFMVMISLQ
jgi:hypothetical protein